MGCVWKRCAADRIHNTITKNLYTSEKQNKIIYTKKNPNDPDTLKLLKKLQEILQKALELPVPNFFA